MRAGDLKLIEFFNDMHVELYNLSNDIGEQQDLAVILPQQADQMRRRLHEWRAEVGAQMPTPNPQHDPARPEYTPPLPKRAERGTPR